MKNHWRISIRQAIAYAVVGGFFSVILAVGIIWHVPLVGDRNYADYTFENFPPKQTDVSLYLRTKSVGIHSRIWHDVDQYWPWDEVFPTEYEAVAGVWVGLPFTTIQKRVEYPHFVHSPGGGIRVHPSYWSPHELHQDIDLYKIQWVGLLANSFFWGALIWLLRGSSRVFQGWRWSKRGCCDACGYSLQGLVQETQCPECGYEISRLKIKKGINSSSKT